MFNGPKSYAAPKPNADAANHVKRRIADAPHQFHQGKAAQPEADQEQASSRDVQVLTVRAPRGPLHHDRWAASSKPQVEVPGAAPLALVHVALAKVVPVPAAPTPDDQVIDVQRPDLPVAADQENEHPSANTAARAPRSCRS